MTTPALAVGIDIGGTKTAVGTVDSLGSIRARVLLSTEAALGFERAVDRLTQAIRHVLTTSPGAGLAGIGIGCAGPVNPTLGLINNPFTLPGWNRCDIVTPLQEQFGVPVFLENDADAAALGECWLGAGQGKDPVVMLTLGTGVGGAAVVAGAIHRGVRGEHPELGHIPVQDDGPACYCGLTGCLESVASGTAIGAAGRECGLADAPAVFAAAQAGQPDAQAIVESACRAVARGAWTLCHTFLPQRIVLGGGIMEDHFDLFASAARRLLSTATQFSHDAVDIVPADLGNEAGLVGAAARVLHAPPEYHLPPAPPLR